MSAKTVESILGEQAALLTRMRASGTPDVVSDVAKAIISSFEMGGKLLIAGNGGSAVDAIHVAGEFTGRFTTERAPLPAMALTSDTAALTCIANDYGYGSVFERQVRAWGSGRDVFLGLSTSGQSENIIQALEAAHQLGMVTVSITGSPDNSCACISDHSIVVASLSVARIQETTMTLWHAICQIVDDHFPTEDD